DSEGIKGRINQIKAEIETTDSDFDREKLQERLAKLSGGVAVVKVGAATETEMKEKKHRVEDALQATRAALEEGIVPGGGVALLQAAEAVNPDAFEDDERTGARIVLRALEEPLRQIAENAGLEGPAERRALERSEEPAQSCAGSRTKNGTYVHRMHGCTQLARILRPTEWKRSPEGPAGAVGGRRPASDSSRAAACAAARWSS